MRKFPYLLVVIALISFSSIAYCTPALPLGRVYGHSLYTDIKTYFNGELIHGINVDGYTAVKVKAFQGRGYDVHYDHQKRRVDIKSNINATNKVMDRPPQKNLKLGTVIGNILSSDIEVYINGKKIDSYNCDGHMLVMVDNLPAYGFVTSYSDYTRRMIIYDHHYQENQQGKTKQSKTMFDFTQLSWSEELELQMASVNFDYFAFDPNQPKQIVDQDSIFVLANKANYFPDDFIPKDLVSPKSKYAGGGDRNRLRSVAADALDQMLAAAEKAGHDIRNVSAYRSISYQRDLFTYYVNKDGFARASQYSSRPGFSEHHTGLCADVSSPSMNFTLGRNYGQTREGLWLAKNAHNYGFVIRYPKEKENITGYTYEPWHLRYFGVPLASYLHDTGLCYEEFLALQLGKQPAEIRIN